MLINVHTGTAQIPLVGGRKSWENVCQRLGGGGPGEVLGARLGTLAQASRTWGRRAEQAQWGPAELLAAALKGVLGLQSRTPIVLRLWG